MTRHRSVTINNDISDAEPTPAPGVMPPEGVEAAVETKIRYNTKVDPDKVRTDRYARDLDDLAAELEPEPYQDRLTGWLVEWQRYIGYNVWVLRLTDPAERRGPGAQYLRPHFNHSPEALGALPFDPNPVNFIPALQAINGNSGGYFQVWLLDQYGQRLPESTLYSFAVADPPRNAQQSQPQTPPPQQPQYITPPKSDAERELETMQREVVRTALQRALNPPTPPAVSALNAEDQAKLYMLGQAPTFFPTMFQQLAQMQREMLEATNASAKEPTWKDRMIDAGLELATKNPAIVDRLSSVAERIVAMVTNALLPSTFAQAPLPPPPASPIQSAPTPAPAPYTDRTEPEDESDTVMSLIDDVVTYLNNDKPIDLNDPIFKDLEKAYPKHFPRIMAAIASMPIPTIIEWIDQNGSDLHRSLLSGPVTGPFLKGRLEELQITLKNAVKIAQTHKPHNRKRK